MKILFDITGIKTKYQTVSDLQHIISGKEHCRPEQIRIDMGYVESNKDLILQTAESWNEALETRAMKAAENCSIPDNIRDLQAAVNDISDIWSRDSSMGIIYDRRVMGEDIYPYAYGIKTTMTPEIKADIMAHPDKYAVTTINITKSEVTK